VGANPYCYFTPYEKDVARALQALREQEFDAGRYDPALQAADTPTYTFEQMFPPEEDFPSPGPSHDSIEEALMEALESGSGTGSILDIMGISATPQPLHLSPTSPKSLQNLFGHASPPRDEVYDRLLEPADEDSMAADVFWDEIGRGEARYFLVYADGRPSEIFFAGMSVD